MKNQVVLLLSAVSICCASVVVNLDKENVVNVVSDKFISFSADPTVLLKEFFDHKEYLCKHYFWAPAYIRFVGGPNFFPKGLEDSSNYVNWWTEDGRLFYLLKWINFSRFTPVFSLDYTNESDFGSWNTTNFNSALDLVEELNITDSFWQISNDCPALTEEEYLKDLIEVKNILGASEDENRRNWKLASGDISKCLKDKPKSFLSKSTDLIDAAVLNKDQMLDKSDSKIEYWKVLSPEEDSKEDAIKWVKNLGNAAKDGYSVIFKNITTFDKTMDYYVSWLIKKYAEVNVLNVETKSQHDVSLFAQCAKMRYDGQISSGVLLYGVNEGDSAENIFFNESMSINGEVEQYILECDDPRKIIINREEIKEPNQIEADIIKVDSLIKMKVSLPPKSIGLWVIPTTDIEACSTVKSNIHTNQCDSFSGDTSKFNQSDELEEKLKMSLINRTKESIADLWILLDSKSFDDPMIVEALERSFVHQAEMLLTMYHEQVLSAMNSMKDGNDILDISSRRSLRLPRSLEAEVLDDKSDLEATESAKNETVSMSELDSESDDPLVYQPSKKMLDIESRLKKTIQEMTKKFEEWKMRLAQTGDKNDQSNPKQEAQESRVHIAQVDPRKFSLDRLRSALKEPISLLESLEKARSWFKERSAIGLQKTNNNDLNTEASEPTVSSTGSAGRYLDLRKKFKEHQLKYRVTKDALQAKIDKEVLKAKLNHGLNQRTKRDTSAHHKHKHHGHQHDGHQHHGHKHHGHQHHGHKHHGHQHHVVV